jgi:hypothetical protein
MSEDRTLNDTDYEFPQGWGLYSDEQKHQWFVRERVFRQSVRQDTYFGRRYREAQARKDRFRYK